MRATAGVGSIPKYKTSIPVEFNPEDSAPSSISPDILVSKPTTIFGLFTPLVKKYPPIRPNLYASSGDKSLFAIPLTPSVPNSFPILPPNQKKFNQYPSPKDEGVSFASLYCIIFYTLKKDTKILIFYDIIKCDTEKCPNPNETAYLRLKDEILRSAQDDGLSEYK